MRKKVKRKTKQMRIEELERALERLLKALIENNQIIPEKYEEMSDIISKALYGQKEGSKK